MKHKHYNFDYFVSFQIELDQWVKATQIFDYFDLIRCQVEHSQVVQVIYIFNFTNLKTDWIS
jgi:predicted Zn-dependent protease